MKMRVFLFLIVISCELFGASKTETKLEVGVFLPKLSGSIENFYGSSDFSKDYIYSDATASYFALDVKPDYDYVPNITANYFYMKENSNTTLDKSVVVADGTFNSKVGTVTDFSVLNTVFYAEFKKKGKTLSFLRWKPYTGDFAFDVGLNAKYLMWNFEITDQTDTTKSPSWIHVHELIPLPYLGFKYYLYSLTLYSDVSALSVLKAKAFNYQVGASYNVIGGLSLSGGYVHEEFKAVEKKDTVRFKAAGYKFSFMYVF